MKNQLDILSESLDKKLQVLQEIQEYNLKQEKAFLSEQVALEQFDAAMEEKEALIQKVLDLDEGFELLYERLSEELKNNRELYKDQIQELQEKIARVTEMSVAVQAQEARNKQLIEGFFAKARTGIRQNRKSSKAAYDYYKSMSGANYPQGASWESKK